MAEKHPKIEVIDEYFILADKSAKCQRTYLFKNDTKSAIQIVGGAPYTEKFAERTANHEIQDYPARKRKLDSIVEGYSRICLWMPSKIQLQAGDSHKIVISYEWPDFIPSTAPELPPRIIYEQRKKVTYSIKITSHEHDFLSKPVKNAGIGSTKLLSDGSLYCGPINMSSNNWQFILELPIRPQLDPSRRLPLLKYFSSLGRKDLFKDVFLVMVQHLLGDFIPFINTFEDCGLANKNCFIVGIPYSTKKETVRVLQKVKGYKYLKAPVDYPFLGDIKKTLEQVTKLCEKQNRKFLVIEDGGYIVPLLHKEFLTSLKYCLGAVEQTANGIWEDRALARKGKLRIPVINVAESKLKKEVEGKLIGKAVVANIERILGRYAAEGTFERHCLVIGLGSVGLNIALTLNALGANVSGFDDKKKKREFAKSKGISVYEDVASIINEQSIIIGGTGQSHIDFNELVASQHNTVFVNATSKRKEIQYDVLEGLTDKTAKIEGVGDRCILNTGKSVVLLANGYPINFFDSESVADNEIQFVPTLLFKGAQLLAEGKRSKPRIYPIPPEIQEDIRKKYLALRKSPIKI